MAVNITTGKILLEVDAPTGTTITESEELDKYGKPVKRAAKKVKKNIV